jgi:hypothetical protein
MHAFLAATLFGVGVLTACDAARPTKPKPGDPLLSASATSEPFFIAWSTDWKTSPIQTIELGDTQGTGLNPGQYRIQWPAWRANDVLLAFAAANPGHLYFNGDEPDGEVGGCIAPETYAEHYYHFVKAVLAADPTAKFSNAGFTEPGTHCNTTRHDTAYAGEFIRDYHRLWSELPRVDEWRFHNFGNNSKNDLAKWKAEVQVMAQWSVDHGAPMYLGSWGFHGWDKPITPFLSDMQDAMSFLRADSRIRGAAWWRYEQRKEPHYLADSSGTALTPEGETYVHGPMSVEIRGSRFVPAYAWCGYYAYPTGGVPPQTSKWWVNGVFYGSGSPIMYQNNGYSYTLRAEVTDKYGVVRSETLSVSIGGSSC